MAATRIWMRSNGAWSHVELDNHTRLHEASHISGGTDAFLSTDVLESIAKRWKESGGTTLTAGAVSDGQYLQRSGTTIIGTTVSTFSFVARTSDSTITSNIVPAADDTLLFAISNSATEIWSFDAWILVSAVNATMDIQIALSLPASATAAWGNGDVAGATANPGFYSLVASGTPSAALGTAGIVTLPTLNGQTINRVAGWVFGGGTAGNVTLKFAQNTSDIGALKIKAGSNMRYWKVVS